MLLLFKACAFAAFLFLLHRLFYTKKEQNRIEVFGNGLFRRRLMVEHFRRPHAQLYERWVYYCDKCLSCLTEGPSGGASMNLVCNKCKFNYGCLPGSYVEYEGGLPPIQFLYITQEDIARDLGQDFAFEHALKRAIQP
jgi:hypothetical protein